MQNAHAAHPALIVDLDELLEATLKPGRHHATFRMPDGAEAIPQPRVAIHGPVFNEFADGDFVGGDVDHRIVHFNTRDCKQSQAIQLRRSWIASSLTPLAMTRQA